MEKNEIIKKTMTELLEAGFNSLPFYLIPFVDRRPTLRQMALSVKTAELIDGLELKLNYNASDYLSEKNKTRVRQVLYKNLLPQINMPNDCFRFYCINDETLLATKKNNLFGQVFKMTEDFFRARIDYLTRLMHSEGRDYKELIVNAFIDRDEAVKVLMQETINGKKLFNYIKLNNLMPGYLIEGSLTIIRGVEEIVIRMIREVYQ